MNIIHALFVPNGTISKSAFYVASGLLILLGVARSGIEMAIPSLGPLLFFVGLVFAYCWVALWIKRFHEAGTSGWWTVLVAIGWLIVQFIAGFMVLAGTGLDFSVFASGDQAAIEAAMEPAVEAAMLPSLFVATLISIAFAFGLNAILPAGRGPSRGETAGAGPDAGGTMGAGPNPDA